MNLISVLMGISIGALLLTSVTQWVMLSKKTFLMHRSQVHFLDAGQTVMQYLLRDIHRAGYRGCRSSDLSFPLNKGYSDWNKDFGYLSENQTVFGFFASPGVCYGKMPVTACKRIKENSAVLIVYHVAQRINPLLSAMKKTNDPLMLNAQHGIHKGALVLISDGYQGDFFIANRIQEGFIFHENRIGLNKSDALSKAYAKEAEVVELQTVAYYLGIPERFSKTDYLNKHSKNIKPYFSLFRDDFLQSAQEIITGVRDVEFEYAIQIPSDGQLRYYKPEAISSENWPLVQAVRIHLELEGKQTFSFEIALRNRLLTYSYVDFFNTYFLAGHTYGNAKHAYLSKNESILR